MRNAIQSVVPFLHAAEWIPMTAARVLSGVFFCISGGRKLFIPAQFALLERTLSESRIPFAQANAFVVSLVELIGGAGLTLGFLTRICALLLTIDMITAIVTNRLRSIKSTGVLAWIDDFLYLPEVLYVIILVWLICSGPGPGSIDARLLASR